MLKSKVVFISKVDGAFTDKDGKLVEFQKANLELEGGELLREVKVQKGALDGLNRFEEVTGYFRYDQQGNTGKLVFTGYTR